MIPTEDLHAFEWRLEEIWFRTHASDPSIHRATGFVYDYEINSAIILFTHQEILQAAFTRPQDGIYHQYHFPNHQQIVIPRTRIIRRQRVHAVPDDHEPLMYLASPYSSPDPAVHDWRFRAVSYVLGVMFNARANNLLPYDVFSPIAHCHPASISAQGTPGDYKFWGRYNRSMLSRAQHLGVLAIPGWEHSTGVRAEMDFATANNIPITMFPDSYFGILGENDPLDNETLARYHLESDAWGPPWIRSISS